MVIIPIFFQGNLGQMCESFMTLRGDFVGFGGAKYVNIGKMQGLCGRGENGGKNNFLKNRKKNARKCAFFTRIYSKIQDLCAKKIGKGASLKSADVIAAL